MKSITRLRLWLFFIASWIYPSDFVWSANQPCIVWESTTVGNLKNYINVHRGFLDDSIFQSIAGDGKNLIDHYLKASRKEDIWIQFCVENHSKGREEAGLVLGNWLVHNAHIYHYQDQLLIDSLLTGFQVPLKERSFNVGYYQVAHLNFAPGSSNQILIHLKEYKYYPVTTSLSLMPVNSMLNQIFLRKSIVIACIGMLLIMLLYGMSLYVNLGSKTYLYYSLHLLGGLINVIAWNGGFAPLLGEHLIWQVPLQQLVAISSWVFYIFFLSHLLDESSLGKWINRHAYLFVIIGVTSYLLSFSFIFIGGNVLTSMYLFLVQAFLFFLAVLFICYKLLKEQDPTARYFLYGSVVFVLALLISTIWELLLPKGNSHLVNDPNLIIPVSLVLEMSFFMIGISTKMRFQEEKAIVQRYQIQKLLGEKKQWEREVHKESLISNTPTKQASELVRRGIDVINSNLSNADFSVNQFAKELFVSRVKLHRKLKSELGLSASEMIRWVRISNAARIFQESEANVTEVSYQVGFQNLSYFATCFRKQYGVNPSEYRRGN